MKAMIFAAGLGTRLRPLTDHTPKALVQLNGVALLEIAIRKLQAAGCTEFIVNVHHFAEQIEDFLQKNSNFGCRIVCSDEREKLLDTGGGLKKAAWFFDDGEPFFVVNADIISNIDLRKMYQTHAADLEALATLAVQSRASSRNFLFDEADNKLSGWVNENTGEVRFSNIKSSPKVVWAFSGIHVCSPRILNLLPTQNAVFSIVDAYLSISKKNIIRAYPHDGDTMIDVGKVENLELAQKLSF